MPKVQKITPFLWYEKGAREAAKHYVSVFGKGSKIKNVMKLTDTPSGTVEVITIELFGQELTLMTAGPFRRFNEAISFVVNCKTQAEVDRYWKKLSADPHAEQCGWLKDRFGVSWQIVPAVLDEMLTDRDKKKAARVRDAMLQMKKIDIAALKKAYRGR